MPHSTWCHSTTHASACTYTTTCHSTSHATACTRPEPCPTTCHSTPHATACTPAPATPIQVKAQRIMSLKANMAAREQGTCSQCKSTSHVAESGACPEVDKLIAAGSKWCNHCSMANHSSANCGILHPGLASVNRKKRQTSTAADLKAEILAEVKVLAAQPPAAEAVQTQAAAGPTPSMQEFMAMAHALNFDVTRREASG